MQTFPTFVYVRKYADTKITRKEGRSTEIVAVRQTRALDATGG